MSMKNPDTSFPNLPPDALRLYGRAVHVISAADGRLTREERELFFADARSQGIDPEIITEWTSYNWRDETVKSILAQLEPYSDARMARRILYNAIKIALADDSYTIEERDAIEEAARILHVLPQELETLNALVRMEQAIAVLRKGLLLDSDNKGAD